MTTFNHAPYLCQALDSVLAQQTAHAYVLYVLDDCSSDGATEILMDYAARYDRIVPIVHETNRGAVASTLELLALVPGKYVALLEGDDYWTDPTKLQTQVDFLDANPRFVLCGHECIVRNEWTGEESIQARLTSDYTLTTFHLIDFHVPTASMVFRNGILREWPDSLLRSGFGDRPLAFMLSQAGNVRFLARPMSVYRVHAGGSWSGQHIVDPYDSPFKTNVSGLRKLIAYWEALREYSRHQFDERIDTLVEWAQAEIARQVAEARADDGIR